MKHNDPYRKMQKARIRLVMEQPFFGSIALGLILDEDPKLKQPMSTNGKILKFNPEFVAGCDQAMLKTYVAHEVMHVVYGHHLRRGDRDRKRWNMAGDFVINHLLKQAGFNLPPQALIHDRYNDEWSTERVYADLQNQNIPPPPPQGGGKPPPGQGQGQPQKGRGNGKGIPGGDQQSDDPGGMGGVEDQQKDGGGGMTESERQAAEGELKIALAQAVQAQKSKGDLPAGLKRLIDMQMEPKIDWKDQLRRFIASNDTPSDYSMSRPNRRFIGAGVYVPGVIKDGFGEIAVVVDTSGSIGPKELNALMAEVRAIADDCSPERVHVIGCDAAVASHDIFERGEFIDCTPGGGGGTSFKPPFTFLEKQGIEPRALVYLSDLYGDFPDRPPNYPVLWVCTTDQVAPWGETVKLDLDA